MKKLLLTLAMMLLLVTVVILVSCGEGASTSETTPAETTPEAPAVTTEELTANGIPVDKLSDRVSALVGEKKFDEEALALMKLIIRDYYDKKGNRVLDANGNTITLWGVGSFLEAVGSVHKMFPDDEEITTVYKGLLNYGLKDYKVRYSSKRVNGVIPYYYNAGAGGTNDYYYDDDEWIALQYLEAYKSFGDKAYLQAAQEILEFIWLGWGLQSDENIGNGGIPWHCKGEGPTTCSNAPAAYAFAIFSTLTSDEKLASDYLERAETVYKWTRTYLYKNGLYRDGYNINKDSFSDWSGSYNNGVMLAVGSLLYTLTGEKSYYRDAQITARNAYTNNTKLEGGRPEFENDTENPWMNAWLVKGYIEFYKVDSTNTVGYLNRFIDIMAFALDNQLESGYLRVQLDELPTKTWTEERDKVKVTLTNDHASTDPTHLGGGISLIIVLAEWAMLYGSNYQ